MKLHKLVLIILLPWCALVATNAEDLYPFPNPAMQAEFQALTEKLRCLVCQNQNIADSDAPLAHDLRRDVYERLLQGERGDEIMLRLQHRYGDFILFQPPVNKATLVLWWGPVGLLLLGGLWVVYVVRRARLALIRS
jgi:cytochrome c-type biogenesis protein CcmH